MQLCSKQCLADPNIWIELNNAPAPAAAPTPVKQIQHYFNFKLTI